MSSMPPGDYHGVVSDVEVKDSKIVQRVVVPWAEGVTELEDETWLAEFGPERYELDE